MNSVMSLVIKYLYILPSASYRIICFAKLIILNDLFLFPKLLLMLKSETLYALDNASKFSFLRQASMYIIIFNIYICTWIF